MLPSDSPLRRSESFSAVSPLHSPRRREFEQRAGPLSGSGLFFLFHHFTDAAALLVAPPPPHLPAPLPSHPLVCAHYCRNLLRRPLIPRWGDEHRRTRGEMRKQHRATYTRAELTAGGRSRSCDRIQVTPEGPFLAAAHRPAGGKKKSENPDRQLFISLQMDGTSRALHPFVYF